VIVNRDGPTERADDATRHQRAVARIVHPPIQQGSTPTHRVRSLMPEANRGDYAPLDPFLRLQEDWFTQGVFGEHPHRGMETVTYVMEGRLNHFDNQGNRGTILPGDAQWMTAGRGIVHVETPREADVVHSFQLWVNLPAAAKMTAPRYQDLQHAVLPVRREPGAEVIVFSGESGGVAAPTLNHASVTMVDLRLQPGASLVQDLPGDYNGFVLVIAGEGTVGADATAVRAGDMAWLTRSEDAVPSEVRVAAGEGTLHALLIAGRPLREPVAAGGPFVMNTEAELAQAFEDFRSGRF
jgi:redox-sensitive bicupin YhaK (pirin superfamily)